MQSNWKTISDLYVEKGLSVIPVNGKMPIIPSWQRYCSELLDESITVASQTGIGLCLGPASDLVAVDIDTDDPEVLNSIPPSPIVRKGKKGEVRFYRYSKNIESRTYRHNKVEILSVGRQAVLPPSIHPETKEPYVWTKNNLLDFDLDLLPTLDLSFLTKLKVFEPSNTGGRNNKLKDITTACLSRGESLEHTAGEVFQYDKEFHAPRLFTDKTEQWAAANESEAQKFALLFVMNIYKSLINNDVVSVNISKQDVVVSESENIKSFELKSYPEPKGILNEIVNLVMESSYTYVPNLALGSAIPIFSTMVGNMFVFDDIFPNSFSLLIADSGAGKKFGINVARKLLHERGLVGSADYASAPAIASSLTDYCVRLDVSDEFSKLLKLTKSNSPWQQSIPQDLCRLWSASSDDFDLPLLKKQKGDEEKPNIVLKPHVSILSATTKTEFKESISKSAFTSGFIPRFLIFMDKVNKDVKISLDFDNITSKKMSLDKIVRGFLDKRRQAANPITGVVNPYRFTIDASANELFSSRMKQFAFEAIDEEADSLKSIMNRSREHFKKLALIHAISRCDVNHIINESDFIWASDIVDTSLHNIKQFVNEASAENQLHSYKERVYTLIMENPKLTQRELTRKTQFINDNTRQSIIKDLMDAGRIGISEDNSNKNGPRKRLYVVIN